MKTMLSSKTAKGSLAASLRETGAREITGIAMGLTSTILLLISTEVGLTLAVVSVAFGLFSAILIHPHAQA